MAERTFAVVLMVVFAVFLFFALDDILRLVEQHQYGEVPLLLFCATACVGWIAFLASLVLATLPENSLRWHRLKWHGPLPRA